ncbi:uncharacterized protein LOC127881348 isoform X6 [Dreissena polymorpha]|uniref:uncharacterized protein LOC127881348 isoform X6 n=1 Tax=Dreissena polymorpha TaxID=45954 RepID=UPI002264462D|nr:uncharacterized protein LOC127881348 isoform X6 [Dreissena polymorpha]
MRGLASMSVIELVIRICIVLIGSTFAAIKSPSGITIVGNGFLTNGATVMLGDALTMKCSMSENISSVTWMKIEASLNAKEESHVLMRLMNDGKCNFFNNTPPTDVYFSCISPRVFSCTIKHTTDVDNEDIWRCWASVNGRNMSSNEIHIYVHDAANSFEDKTRSSKDAPVENMYITVLPQKEGSEQNSSANVGNVRRTNTHHNDQPLHLSSSANKTYDDMHLRTEGCTTQLDNIHKRQKHVNLSPLSPPCSAYESLSPELRRHSVYDYIKPEQCSL